ncbi:MAG: protein of unknown function DUF1232, partial [uncultured Acetobacteraceae bacterium]
VAPAQGLGAGGPARRPRPLARRPRPAHAVVRQGLRVGDRGLRPFAHRLDPGLRPRPGLPGRGDPVAAGYPAGGAAGAAGADGGTPGGGGQGRDEAGEPGGRGGHRGLMAGCGDGAGVVVLAGPGAV